MDESLLKIWLIILTVMVVLIVIYIIFVPNVNIYVDDGNYTLDLGENMMKVYNSTLN